MLAILAMLVRQSGLRVAPGGSAPPISFVARRGLGAARSGGKAGSPIELKSEIGDVAVRIRMSRAGLRVTAVAGVQFRVEPLQRRGLRSRACW